VGSDGKIYTDGGSFGVAIYNRLAPFNIALSKSFAADVRHLHHLLDRALVDVVERWYRDEEAGFPARMPLENHEEGLLKWIDGDKAAFVRPFRDRYGAWRTDYLIERDDGGNEVPKICEINSRIPVNGLWMIGLHGEWCRRQIERSGVKGFEVPNDLR